MDGDYKAVISKLKNKTKQNKNKQTKQSKKKSQSTKFGSVYSSWRVPIYLLMPRRNNKKLLDITAEFSIHHENGSTGEG